jgi:TolA-binding protein
MAGYKLWEQKKFEDAETQLARVAKQYPKHKRASYARNLIGRSQLDDGRPAMAAQTFYSNYQTDPRGERAPDSLFYLGQALMQLKKPADACKAYGELEQVYGSTMAAGLKSRLPAAKKAAGCK